MLGYVYGSKGAKLSSNQDLGVKVATPVGTFIGQLFFGFLADQVGRKRMYGIELMIIIIATFAQALAGSAPSVTIIGAIVIWRGIVSQPLTAYPSWLILPDRLESAWEETIPCQL
jgi:PHS family inorganic phosphate transporter-like MFS transporter